jgi:hypothetical protein
MNVVEKIIAEDSGETLQKHVTELEAENSRLKAIVVESAETIATLQHSVDAGIEDYELLQKDNKSLLAERNEQRYHSRLGV